MYLPLFTVVTSKTTAIIPNTTIIDNPHSIATNLVVAATKHFAVANISIASNATTTAPIATATATTKTSNISSASTIEAIVIATWPPSPNTQQTTSSITTTTKHSVLPLFVKIQGGINAQQLGYQDQPRT